VRIIGFKEVAELPLRFGQYGAYLFGECTLPLLTDPVDTYELQGRGALNEGMLSNALYALIATEADKLLGRLATTIEGTTLGRKRKNLERLNLRLSAWLTSKLPSSGL